MKNYINFPNNSTKVQSNGNINLKKEVRDFLEIEEGDYVTFFKDKENKQIIIKATKF